MRLVGGKSLKTLLLVLMSTSHSYSLLRISYMLMSPYHGGTDRVVIGSIFFFPMYVTMDRKPENGVEIHNSACGRSGIMIRISIFKSANNEEEQKYDRDNLPHGTKVLKEIVMP